MNKLPTLLNHQFQTQLANDFKKNGYIHYPGFLANTEVALIKSKIDDFLLNDAQKIDKSHFLREHNGQTIHLKKLFYYHLFFEDLIFNSRFEQLAETLLQDDVSGENIEYFYHPPYSSASFPAHQDGAYFTIAPWEAISIWVALEDMDLETGCLHYIKGSHIQGMREHEYASEEKEELEIKSYNDIKDEKAELAFPIKTGDILVHHALTINRLSTNVSPFRARQALRFTYYANKTISVESGDFNYLLSNQTIKQNRIFL